MIPPVFRAWFSRTRVQMPSPGSRALIAILYGSCVVGLSAVASGCGFDRLQGDLPAAVPGFTISDLEAIQTDGRLTDEEKRQRIRDAVNADDNDNGDRLVDFLLNFNVP